MDICKVPILSYEYVLRSDGGHPCCIFVALVHPGVCHDCGSLQAYRDHAMDVYIRPCPLSYCFKFVCTCVGCIASPTGINLIMWSWVSRFVHHTDVCIWMRTAIALLVIDCENFTWRGSLDMPLPSLSRLLVEGAAPTGGPLRDHLVLTGVQYCGVSELLLQRVCFNIARGSSYSPL